MVVDTSSFGLSKEGETGSDFARPPIKSKGKLWNEGDPALSHSTALATVAHAFQLRNARASGRRHNASKSAPMPPAADEPEDPSVSLIITQPETRSISQEQLVAEVKEIYAGLVMIESKCIEVDSAHSVQNDNAARPSNDQLQVPQAQGEGITKITYDTMLADHPYTYSPRKNPPPANNSTVDYSSGGRVRYVDGEANGVSVRSLPDTGAAECCISSSFATRLGKTPMQGTARKVAVGSGKKLSSPGTVSLVWRFQDETDLYDMVCTVVPGLKHDLILGLPFLKLTKTMSKFKHRIKHTVSKVFTRFSKKLFFSLLGVQRQRLWGLLDGELTGVVPDSGSDVVLISEAYAKQRGFKVNRRNADRLELEFADGSIGRTSGVVENLTWAFDDKTSIKTNFYVLRGLPVDVVLSNDLLFDFDVYSSYEHQILDADASAAAELLFVRLLGRYKSKHRDAENINELRPLSPEETKQKMREAEVKLRDQTRDNINRLPLEARDAAWREEHERRRQWKAEFARLGVVVPAAAPAPHAIIQTVASSSMPAVNTGNLPVSSPPQSSVGPLEQRRGRSWARWKKQTANSNFRNTRDGNIV